MIYFIPLLLLLNFALQAQTVTYQDLFASASKNSIKLKMFKEDVNIESYKVETIYAKYYPTLALSYNTEYNRDLGDLPSATESIGDSVITSGTKYQSSISLNLNHELYHFGATEDSIGIAKKEVTIKKLNWCEEEKKLHQTILDRYSSAIKSKIKISIKDEMLNIRQELYKIKQRLHKAGKYSKLELGDEAITMIDLEKDIELALLQYQEDIIHLSSLSHVELDEKNIELVSIGFENSDCLTDKFEETALGHKYAQQVKQKEQEILMLTHSQYPTLSLYGNYYMYGSDQNDAYQSFDNIQKNSWKLGLAIRLNIFEGFKYSHTSQTLKHELQRIKDELDLQKREYEYNAKMKLSKLSYLKTLAEKDENMHDKTTQKMDMINRLRESYQVDRISELNTMLEALERKLNLKIQQRDMAYENASLDILFRGATQCTQH
ncbi:TolC family protein [Sulfurimonas sp.]|uniref:TolC family protein n=1 Tax=Sulfurimonas sp. TaxID=2022749 RepID=UPI00286D772C|nr:TolC family protein [Sulfurimonas sp.]